MLAPFGRVVGLGDTVNVTNMTVKDYLRREGAPMFWPQIMQSGLYARVKSLEPRDFVAVFGDPFRRGVRFVDRCRIMRLGRWRVVHEYGGETAIDHKVADEALVGRVLGRIDGAHAGGVVVFPGLLVVPFGLVLRAFGMSSEQAQCFLFGHPGISEPALIEPGPGHLANTNDARTSALMVL
jgi:hypothetical protein